MVVALAGRRIDEDRVEPSRFPLKNVPLVNQRLRVLLQNYRATVLVSSAACGADLLAQSTAGELGIRRRIILPYERERFRRTSVTDRPGEWGPVYDRVLRELDASSNVVTLKNDGEEIQAFARVNLAILDDAQEIGKVSGDDVLAVTVWEGGSRGGGDLTSAFGYEARRRGMRVIEINTI